MFFVFIDLYLYSPLRILRADIFRRGCNRPTNFRFVFSPFVGYFEIIQIRSRISGSYFSFASPPLGPLPFLPPCLLDSTEVPLSNIYLPLPFDPLVPLGVLFFPQHHQPSVILM